MINLLEILLVLIIFIHLHFFYMEFFGWSKMIDEFYGDKDKLPKNSYDKTGIILKNQALYNGFLASGLMWSFFITDPILQINVATFFLFFIIIAGVYGGLTINKKIFFIQALPALVALIVIIFYNVLK